MRRWMVPLLVMTMVLWTAGLALSEPSTRAVETRTMKMSKGPVFSDFNGDGFADLAVGANFDDAGTVHDAGAVNVVYGSPTGLQTTSPASQSWTQDSPGIQDLAETDDEFGAALAAADFNGDGFADLAVGVRAQNVGAGVNAGAVNVIYGSSCGLQADPTCGNPDDQFWSQDSPGIKDVSDNYDQFGIPLSAGDFNNDGFADLVVGVPNESLPDAPGAGAVNVIYGSPTGLQAGGATGRDDQFWTQNSPGVKDKAALAEGFGAAIGTGDFNSDGFDDLAIGAPLQDIHGLKSAGSVNVLYGSATGLQAGGASGRDDQFWSQATPGMAGDGAEADDHFGIQLGSGDFNQDGFPDLAVGARYEDVGTIVDAGAVDVLYGSATGLQDTGTGGPDDQYWTQDTAGMAGDGAETGDLFGRSFAPADFNQDGFVDLAIGVPVEAVGAVTGAGAVNVLYGSATGLQDAGTGGPDDQFWNQDSPDVEDTAESGDRLGDHLGAGDFNGDGFPDLSVSAWGEDVATIGNAGAVNVIYGSSTGLQADGVGGPDDQFWNQGSAGMAGDGAENNDRFGSWVTASS